MTSYEYAVVFLKAFFQGAGWGFGFLLVVVMLRPLVLP